MKLLIMTIIFVSSTWIINSKDYTIEECKRLAVENSTYSKQEAYYSSINALRKLNFSSYYLPQIRLEASANYQSDVFSFPLKFPGVTIPEVEKFQYQASLNIYQNIYEGGMVSAGKEAEDAELSVNKAAIDVNNQKIKEIVNDLFFNILIINENIKVSQNYISTLEARQGQIQSLINNGVMLKSALSLIEIELLKIKQKINILETDKFTLHQIIAKWINDESFITANLIMPSSENLIDKNNRPELNLFSQKANLFDKKKEMSHSQIMPNLSAFAKAGYGSPNPFNFFENDLSPFYMLGVKFQWNMWDWSSNARSRQELSVNKELVSIEKELFDKNLYNQLIKEINDIDKYTEIIKQDLVIISKQKEITEQFNFQFQNGIVTTSELITELNNLTQLEINYEIHKIQLVNAKYNYSLKLGN